MSSRPLIIHSPLLPEEILEEERFDLDLPDIGFTRPLVIVPWRSLVAAKKLDTVKSVPQDSCFATVLRFELEDPQIKDAIAERGFKVLFCTSTSRNWPITNLAYPDFVSSQILSQENKTIPFSFVGWNNNSVRREIFERFKGNPSVIERDVYSYGVEQRSKDHANEYINILSKSRFSLCPKGIGSGTKRFWESLKAGAIPIVISDDFRPPSCWNWKDTAIFLKEWQFMENPYKIQNAIILPPGREKLLRENCYRAYESFSNPTFVARYLQSILNGS